jgi:hypothetical protein
MQTQQPPFVVKLPAHTTGNRAYLLIGLDNLQCKMRLLNLLIGYLPPHDNLNELDRRKVICWDSVSSGAWRRVA